MPESRVHEDQGRDRRDSSSVPMTIALVALSAIVVPVVLHSLLFLVGVPLTAPMFAIGLVLGALMPLAFQRSSRALLLAYALVFAVTMVGLVLQASSWDNAHDSLTYHEPPAIAIADGANPIGADLGHVLADHYPKAAWVFSGGLYALTGNLETGKAMTVLLAIASCGVAVAVLRAIECLPRPLAYVLAGLIALNPVTVMQLDTHYVDGQFASLAMILVLLVLADETGTIDRFGSAARLVPPIAVMSAILLSNLKFTGLVAAVVLALAHALRRRYRGGSHRAVNGHHVRLVVLTAVLVLVVGFDPYVTNTLDHGHPFYPLFGAEKPTLRDAADTQQRPVAYRDVSAPVAFVMSLTERTDGGAPEAMAHDYELKNPLSVTREELAALTLPDPRTGGFGPLFLLALLLGLGSLAIACTARDGRRCMSRSSLVYVVTLVGVLTLAMVEAWWARLAPVFFVTPIVILVGSWTRARGRTASRILAVVIVAVLMVNGGLILAAQTFDYRNRRIARESAMQILEGKREVVVRFPDPWVAEMQSASLVRRIEDLGFTVAVEPYEGTDARGWTYVPSLMAETKSD